MKKYGAVLMQNVPEETTKFLKQLCTTSESNQPAANPEDFIYLFINNPEAMVEFLEHMVTKLPKVSCAGVLRPQGKIHIYLLLSLCSLQHPDRILPVCPQLQQ